MRFRTRLPINSSCMGPRCDLYSNHMGGDTFMLFPNVASIKRSLHINVDIMSPEGDIKLISGGMF